MLEGLGDYRCTIGGDTETVQMLVYLGGLLGVVISALLLTYLTQKKVLLGTLIANLIGLGVVLASGSLWVAGLGLFLNFMGRAVQSDLVSAFVSENTDEEIRVKYLMYVEVAFALGGSLVALAYWGLKPWELALGSYQLLPYVIALTGFILWMEETPFDLVTVKSSLECAEAFHRIAVFNNVACDISVD